MGLSKTDLRFLADNARAKMLDTWRDDGGYVASATNKVFTVGSDGNIYHTNISNGIDEDGNNIGPGAVDPTSSGQSIWSNDFTFETLRVDTILASDGSQTTPPSIPGLDVRFSAAWVNFNGQGVVSIRESYNVSSITDNGTGSYDVNFINALSGNYSALVGGNGTDGARLTTVGSSSCSFQTRNSGSPADASIATFAAFSS